MFQVSTIARLARGYVFARSFEVLPGIDALLIFESSTCTSEFSYSSEILETWR